MNFNIPILLGTTRKNNQSEKVVRYLFKKLQTYSNVDTQILDLGKADFPIMEERLDRQENPPELLASWNEILSNANAIIIVAPEYKNGYPGSLKNFLDYLPAGAFRYKPIGISTVSSTPHGGTNCLAQLRLVCLSLAGIIIPDRFQVGEVTQAFDENGNFKNPKTNSVAEKFLNELIKYTNALHAL